MPALLRFFGAVEQDPSIQDWLSSQAPELRSIAEHWFARMRRAGPNTRELMHDGFATACVRDAPFAYVGAFKSHVNVGFFHGVELPDPAQPLQGSGKRMRHVKLRPGAPLNAAALEVLIAAAYDDIVERLKVAV